MIVFINTNNEAIQLVNQAYIHRFGYNIVYILRNFIS